MHEVDRDRGNDGGVEVCTDELADKVEVLEQIVISGESEEGNGKGERGVNRIYGLMSELALARGVFNEMISGRWVG